MTVSPPPPEGHPRYSEWLTAYRHAIEARQTYFALKAELPEGDPVLLEIAPKVAAAEEAYNALCAEIAKSP
jgi:hypothetical protein